MTVYSSREIKAFCIFDLSQNEDDVLSKPLYRQLLSMYGNDSRYMASTVHDEGG
jgi:hypothetical protein